MDHFSYQSHSYHAEDVSIRLLAEKVGTPFYCYSTATLERHYTVFCDSLSGLDYQVCFAVKANSNRAVLATLARMGAGADVVSEGEIRRAIASGISSDKIVFSGVGKTRDEMAFALEKNIFQFNVESEPELLALSEIAAAMDRLAPIAIRINPDVDAKTHAKISTGKAENKFGVPIALARALYAKAATLPGIRVQGVSMHIGSQLTDLAPFDEAYARAAEFVRALRADGHTIDVLDVGGGLGVPYDAKADAPPLPFDYGAVVKKHFESLDCRLVFEPGRLLVANAGILVSRVIYVKETGAKRFVIVDAAMNDLVRPAMYGAYHDIIPVDEFDNAPVLSDIVGPVCETGDTFAENRPLAPVSAGDLVAFRTAGAYGAVMSNSYNSRPLVPEVMVKGDRAAIIRPRPSYTDMLNADVLPDWL